MNTPHSSRIGVLFVCMGNICRSPLAKALFDHHTRRAGRDLEFDIDSCGTGAWHAGQSADPRTIQIASAYQIPLTHRARQFDAATDLPRFACILAMDLANIRSLSHMGCPESRVTLLRSFDPALAGTDGSRLEVPDPYYGGDQGFELMYRMIDAACQGLLIHLSPPPQTG